MGDSRPAYLPLGVAVVRRPRVVLQLWGPHLLELGRDAERCAARQLELLARDLGRRERLGGWGDVAASDRRRGEEQEEYVNQCLPERRRESGQGC